MSLRILCSFFLAGLPFAEQFRGRRGTVSSSGMIPPISLKKTGDNYQKKYTYKLQSPKSKKIIISISRLIFQASYSLDYITVCDLKRAYYDEVDKHTKPRLNYTIGGMAMFRKNRILINVDAAYTSYRERFAMEETRSINKHQVLTASLDFGYSLYKKKEKKILFEILLIAGVGYLRTLQYSGSTLDKSDYSNIITLLEQDTYDSSSLIAGGKILGSYQLTKNKTLLFGPTYSTNILSITRESVPFGKWRHNVGFMVGLGIGL